MITITFKVDTNEHGKVCVSAQATGIGSTKESVMAVGVFEAGRCAYEAITALGGGIPRTTMDPKSRITKLGQG